MLASLLLLLFFTAFSQIVQQQRVTSLTDQLDYSVLGLISHDQKTIDFCDSSWAIAAAYLYEYTLRKNYYRGFVSEQAIIQCTTYYAPNRRRNDCSGGHFQDALNFLAKVGGVPKQNYPNSSYSFNNITATSPSSPICVDHDRLFAGSGTVKIYNNLQIAEIKQKLKENGPLLVQIQANPQFIRYTEGQFTECQGEKKEGNSLVVLLFGYKGDQYWLIKAPFGSNWGYMGSMKVHQNGTNLVCIKEDDDKTNIRPHIVLQCRPKYEEIKQQLTLHKTIGDIINKYDTDILVMKIEQTDIKLNYWLFLWLCMPC